MYHLHFLAGSRGLYSRGLYSRGYCLSMSMFLFLFLFHRLHCCSLSSCHEAKSSRKLIQVVGKLPLINSSSISMTSVPCIACFLHSSEILTVPLRIGIQRWSSTILSHYFEKYLAPATFSSCEIHRRTHIERFKYPHCT